MTEALRKPPKKNPVARTRQVTLPPGTRSRCALGLTAAAALGRFELQVCPQCRTVQYPPREVCGHCLSDRLAWQAVSPLGTLLASTVLHHSNDLYFRERLPWRIGTVHLAAGPAIVAHVHGDCVDGDAVRLALKLDRSGQAVMIALPEQATPNMEDDRTLRETSCNPRLRRALVTDGKTALGMAMITALLDAGAGTVFAGDPETWKKSAEFNALCKDPRIQVQALNVTDSDSVERISRSIGGKVVILRRFHPRDALEALVANEDVRRVYLGESFEL